MGCTWKPAPPTPRPIDGPPPQNPKYRKRWKASKYERDYEKALAALDKEFPGATKEITDEEEAAKYAEHFRAQYTGTDNAGRPLFLR